MNSPVKKALDALKAALTTVGTAVDALAAALEDEAGGPGEPLPLTLKVTEATASTLKVEWQCQRNDVQRWKVERDGQDAHGAGPWFTEQLPAVRSFVFSSLRPSTIYTITLTPISFLGDTTPVSVKATTAADVTVPPVGGGAGAGQTAALRYGWGAPHPVSDEFDTYEGPPDPAKWSLPGRGGWDGHNGNGRRMPENVFVKAGMMTLRGDPNGNTGWVRQKHNTTYGRWEIRSRSRNTSNSGGLYHPLHLLWPCSERWPEDGELDLLEYMDPDAKKASAFLHYPHRGGIQIQQVYREAVCDMTKWHNFGYEWTRAGVKSWIDGQPWYDVRDGGGPEGRRNIQDMPMGSLTIQLDNFTGDGGLRAAVFEIEWVRFYPIR